jgi:hypothetical protein
MLEKVFVPATVSAPLMLTLAASPSYTAFALGYWASVAPEVIPAPPPLVDFNLFAESSFPEIALDIIPAKSAESAFAASWLATHSALAIFAKTVCGAAARKSAENQARNRNLLRIK